MQAEDSESNFSIVPLPSQDLVVAQEAHGRILCEMVEASLVLARNAVLEPVDLDALVREGKKLYLNKGEGMTEENIQGFNLFYRAAEAGHIEARYLVYRCYRFGDGVRGDKSAYLEWLRKSDEAGFPKTLIALGLRHANDNKEYPKDEDEAIELYRKASQIGTRSYVLAAYILISGIYKDRQDYTEELEWMKKAAELGSWDTLISVIYAYKRGEALPQNYMAYTYEGNAIPQSHVEAYKWLVLGIDESYVTADKAAALAALMSPYELETAQRLYREFKEKYSAKR